MFSPTKIVSCDLSDATIVRVRELIHSGKFYLVSHSASTRFGGKSTLSLCNATRRTTYAASSEHAVLFMNISNDEGEKKDVILRVFLHNDRVCFLSRDHVVGLHKNYSKLDTFLKQNGFSTVRVVPHFYGFLTAVDGEHHYCWLEENVQNFTKFTATSLKLTQKQRICLTDVAILKQVQLRMREKQLSPMIDMQGSFSFDGIYTLCDLEFTNTLGKFNFTEAECLAILDCAYAPHNPCLLL